jgi:rhodanese-related sulfurtransferase
MNTIPMIDCHEFVRAARGGEPWIVVDVRQPLEFREFHIPGSRNVPLSDLESASDDIARDLEGMRVLLVCRSGRIARAAQRMLSQSGHAGSAVLTDGINAWIEEGGEVVRQPRRFRFG